MRAKLITLAVVILVFVAGLSAQTTTLSVDTQIAAGNVSQGTVKHPIFHFHLARNATGSVNLTGVNFTTAGTYAATDVNKFQLWYNTSDALSSATQISSDITSGLGTGSHSFASFSQLLTASATRYFWITTDVAISATTSNTINVAAWTTANFTVSSGTTSGSASASGSQTITAFASLSTDYFRSRQTGNWGTAGTWESSHDNSNWATATLAPSNTANTITIRTEHTVTVATSVSTDQTTIDSGGQVNVSSGQTLTIAAGAGTDLTVNGTLRSNAGTITTTGSLVFGSGGLYQHNFTTTAGTIPTATWDTNSTCEVVGYTSYTGNLSIGQTYGNFTWNCPNQTGAISANETLDTINGTLKISSSGTGSFVLGNNGNTTTVGGNMEISGGTFNMSAGGNLIINLTGNLTLSGGTLTESGGGSGAINFAKTGTQVLSITGSPTVSNTINFTVNSGAILEFETASTVLSGSGGTFTASSGSGLIIKHASGIASTGSTGCVQTTGTRTFNTGANYTYTGSTAQVTGAGLTGANNLTFSNTAGTTLSAALTTIAGTCTIDSGATLATNNYNMAFQGNFVNNGTFTAGSSNITIGAGTATQSIAGFTTTGTVSMTKTGGTATLAGNVNGAALTISGLGGTLNLGTGLTHTFTGTWTRTNGTLNGGSSTLRLGSGFSGTSGTFTAGTGTVEYYASGPQSIAGVAYNNLTLTGSGAKTTTGATVNGILSLEGTATTTGTVATYGSAATLQYKGTGAQTTGTEFPATFAGTGGVIIANTSGNAVTLGGAKVVSLGPVTINTSAILATNNLGLSFGGNFTNNGTFNAGSSAITIQGTATQSIAGFTTTGTVSMTKTGGTATLAGNVNAGALTINGTGGTLNLGTGLTHTISGTWTRSNGTLNGGSSTLKLGGTISGTGGTFTASTGTVEYYGTTQTVANLTYNNLTISTSGTKTLAAALLIGTTGTLTINNSATLATANYALTFQGNFVNNGTLTAGSSTVTISGAAATQNIAGFTTTGLVSMTKTAGIATLTGNASGAGLTINGTGGTLNLGTGLTHTFTGTWTRTAGTLDGGSSTLRLGSGISGTGGTFTPGTGTVEYYASGTQTIAAITYNNLTLSGTSAKTITGATVNGIFSIEGTATTTGTVLTYGASASLRYNGSGIQTVGIEWPASFARNITIANTNGVTLDASKTPYTGTLTNNGKLNCGNYQLSGSVNNNGTITAARTDIMSSGTLTNNTGSTIEYTTALTIPASTGYYNLTLSASGTYILGGNVTGINVLTLTTATTYLHPSGYTLGYTTLAGLGSIISTSLITLASDNPAVPAGGMTAGSTNNIFYAFSTAVNTSSATLNSVTFTTAGTAVVTTDLSNFKLWYSTSNVFSGASQLGSTMTTGLSAGSHTFSGLSQVIASGTTGYYWITADLASGATSGRTLQVTPAITTSNLTFASGTKTGTAYEGGLKTISTVFCVTSDYAVPASNVAISQTKVPLYRFTLQNTTASSINITGLSFITGGSYVATDIDKYQLWTNTSDDLSGASQVGSNLTTGLAVGSHSFAAFTQAISASSTRYFWITTDFTASAVVDNVIGVAALTSSNITLSSGSLTVTAYSGGAQRVISSQVTLRSANPALPAANVGQDTIKYPIYRFTISTNEPVGSVNLTAASFTTAGTYQSTDVTKFQLWTSATDQLDDAVQIGSDITTSLGTGSHTFSSLSQAITTGGTRFFWITANLPLTAVGGRTINVSAMTTSDITVSAGTKGGTAYASSDQTITLKGWDYTKRQPIAQLSGAGSGYQIKYIVNYGSGTDSGNTVYLNGNCRTDFGDVRFYNGQTELKYWMESMTSGTTATFWVKLAGDLSAGNVNVDINYGNSSAVTTSNGLYTFAVFDDFGSDLTKWIKYKYIEGSTASIPSGQSYVRLNGGIPTGTYGHSVIGSYPGYNGFYNNIVEYRYRVGDDAISEVSIRSKFEYSTGTVVAGRGYKSRSDQRDGEGQSIHRPPFYGWTFIGGSTGDGIVPSVDQWYRGTFTAFGNDLKFYRDGTLMRSVTNSEYPETGEITLQNHYGLAGGSYTDYDWVFVRKNAGAEPTYNSWLYPNQYFRTIATGDWDDPDIWEFSPDNTNWSPANLAPDAYSLGILIRNGHTVTVTADVFADQLTVNSGGELVINDGIAFEVNDGSGTDVTVDGTLVTLGDGILYGSGSFTLGTGAYLETQNADGVSTTASTGCIQVTGTLTLDDTANYTFNGTSAQVTGNAIDTADDFTLDNAAGLTFTNAITINGILYQINGDINSANTDYVDGYESQDYNRLRFPETGYNISGWSIAMTTPDLFPIRINRQWVITGTYTNDKVATFYWSDTDDSYYAWSNDDPPAVYQGETKLTTTSWSDASPREITVTLNSGFGAKGTFTIGREDGGTLPVELSSFLVQFNSSNQVVVQWVTQSETGVSGFNIYRGRENDLSLAEHLNVFIPATNTSQIQLYQYTDNDPLDMGTYYYWLENLDLDGSTALYGPVSILVSDQQTGTPPIPVIPGINTIYPNPFNPTTRIVFGLSRKGLAELEVYNLRGQLVKRLLSESKDKGTYQIIWDGTNSQGMKVGSGVYIARLKGSDGTWIKRMVLTN
ncbi:hypothetical protein MASR1M36_18010 [Candidatus Cloacimonadaceae bacterium]